MDAAAEQVSFEDNLSLLDNLLLYPQLPETLSLLSDSIVLLDTYKDIFIWVGNQRPFVENDYLYQYLYNQAVELAESRYPSPSIHLKTAIGAIVRCQKGPPCSVLTKDILRVAAMHMGAWSPIIWPQDNL